MSCWGDGSSTPVVSGLLKPVSITAMGGYLCAIDAGVTNQNDMVNSLLCFDASGAHAVNSDADLDGYSDSCEQNADPATDPLDDTDYPTSCP